MNLNNNNNYNRYKQGFPVYLCELRIVNDKGIEQPWDGIASGEVQGIYLFIYLFIYNYNNFNFRKYL